MPELRGGAGAHQRARPNSAAGTLLVTMFRIFSRGKEHMTRSCSSVQEADELWASWQNCGIASGHLEHNGHGGKRERATLAVG